MSNKNEPSLFQVTVQAVEQIEDVLRIVRDEFVKVADGRESMTPERAATFAKALEAARVAAAKTCADIKAIERGVLDRAATPPRVM